MDWKKLGIFAGGTLFGAAGLKALSGRDAKKVYTHCTAAVLRVKDAVMDQVTVLQENCADIYEGAKQMNEERDIMDVEMEIDDADEEKEECMENEL